MGGGGEEEAVSECLGEAGGRSKGGYDHDRFGGISCIFAAYIMMPVFFSRDGGSPVCGIFGPTSSKHY